jgi:hypothetical protein
MQKQCKGITLARLSECSMAQFHCFPSKWVGGAGSLGTSVLFSSSLEGFSSLATAQSKSEKSSLKVSSCDFEVSPWIDDFSPGIEPAAGRVLHN